MATGENWLESIANDMKDDAAKGAAPTLVRVTPRELVGKFGYMRRGDYINSRIRNALERYNLGLDQDFAVVWADSTITIRLDQGPLETSKAHPSSDPTHPDRLLGSGKQGSIECQTRQSLEDGYY